MQAAKSYRQAIQLEQRRFDDDPTDPEACCRIAAAYNNLGGLDADDETAQAIESYRAAVHYQEQAVALRPSDSQYRSDLASTYNNLASTYSKQRNLAQAARAFSQAIDIQQKLVRESPAQKINRLSLAVSLNNYALALTRLGRTQEAEQVFRQALAEHQALVSQFPQDIGPYSSFGGVDNNLGILLEKAGRKAEAAEVYRQAIEHQREAVRRAPKVDKYRAFLSKHYDNYRRILRQLGEPEQAVQAALQQRELWPDQPRHLFDVARGLALAGNLLTAPEQTAERTKCMAQSLETLRQAVALGFSLPEDIADDEAFTAVRNQKQFKDLTNR